MRRSRFVSLILGLGVFCAVPVFADLTGTWSGTYTATITSCNPAQQTSGSVSASLLQTGSSVTGDLVVEVKVANCKPQVPAIPVGIPVSGSVSGNDFHLQFVVDVPGGPLSGSISGSVSGSTMTVFFESSDGSGSATLTQTSTSPPTSALSGTYSGTYNAVIVPCGRLAPVSYSGTLSGSLTQAGTTLAGVFTGTGFKKDQDVGGVCSVVDDPNSRGFFSAQISGSLIFGVLIFGHNDVSPFIGQISGTTITAHASGEFPGEGVDFTLSRTSSTVSPAIVHFDADPSSIAAGQSSTLSWSTLNASSVTIDNGVGAQPAVGSVTVKPATTTTYTLTAAGAIGSVTATATVTVSGGGGANIAVSSFPQGMVQVAGQGGGTDSFALRNIGSAAGSVTLSTSGNFFSITPASFNLAAGATQTITVTGSAQPAGFFEGSVSVSGTSISIPIRLLSATPPSGKVTAAPTVARSDVSAPVGQNPSGSVSFTNSGSGVLQGIAVADVPWIIPQSGVITIQPGETKAITFTIDSSKRPDAASPLGGVTGKISLVFISGASGKNALGATPTSNVSVTIVYVVAPGVTAGSPAPLGANELALFVPGMQNRPKAIGDLLIANKQSAGPITDLKLYFQGSGLPSQFAALPQIGANGAVALPGLLKNIFSSNAQSGTAQIRGSDVSKVAVAAVQSNNSSPSGTFGTALPVFRSDRGIGSGAQIIIAGVDKEAGIQTDLYIQELTGNAATVQIDFLGVDGNVLSSRAQDTLQAFGFLEIIDAVPDPAVAAVRIKNTSSGAAKIGAYGLVINPKSGDRWVANDPVLNGQPTDDTLIIPLTSSGAGADNLFWATNRTATSSSITLDVRSGARRRAVGAHGISSSPAAPTGVSTSTLRPYETLLARMPTSGYVRISSSANAISAVARSVIFIPNTGVFGSGLPAQPISAAVGGGDLRRFAGVEDASQLSRSTAAPGTFRTNLILIETAGQPATARVTLRYSFVAGATVSAAAVSSKEYSLTASQYLLISDIARDVIGSARDSFGDLHNMELDVEVTGGAGRVLPYLQSIDNGSGDGVMRTE